MTTISREDALKAVQDRIEKENTKYGMAETRCALEDVLDTISSLPESGSYTREQVVPLSVITEKLEDIKKYYIDTLTYPLSHAKTKHLPLAGRKLEDFIKMELPGLASLPAHGDGWISVEDRLPEENQECTFCHVGLVDPLSKEMINPIITTGYYQRRFFYSWLSRDRMQATHWMPKPSPPVKQ